jgi:hypothetical protein
MTDKHPHSLHYSNDHGSDHRDGRGEHREHRVRAPARRATDAYIAVGFCGIAGFLWVVVYRVSQESLSLALLYGAFAAAVTLAGVGIARLVFLHHLSLWRRDHADSARRSQARERLVEKLRNMDGDHSDT